MACLGPRSAKPCRDWHLSCLNEAGHNEGRGQPARSHYFQREVVIRTSGAGGPLIRSLGVDVADIAGLREVGQDALLRCWLLLGGGPQEATEEAGDRGLRGNVAG